METCEACESWAAVTTTRNKKALAQRAISNQSFAQTCLSPERYVIIHPKGEQSSQKQEVRRGERTQTTRSSWEKEEFREH